MSSEEASAPSAQSAVERLAKSEAELSLALKAGRLGTWMLDCSSGELTTSETCRTNFGRPADATFTYEELKDAVHPDDRKRMVSAVERSIATGEVYDIEYRAITPCGDIRWIQIRAQPSYAANGAPM